MVLLGGDWLKLDDNGTGIRVPSGEGNGSGHRHTGPFQVVSAIPSIPITRGMPREWMHAHRTKLYDNMRGPD